MRKELRLKSQIQIESDREPVMTIDKPLIEVKFLRRYKRFLTDVEMPSGEVMTVHCPNSGSMKGCDKPNSRAWISDSENPKRKLRYTLEIIEIDGVLIAVNTQRPNHLVEEAIKSGIITELSGYPTIRREVKYGQENSRIDLLLEDGDRRCFVEVKNVTMGDKTGLAQFPDAVTKRGTKHLRELMDVVAHGDRAVLVFCVSRTDATTVRPADAIDPEYGKTLRAAATAGVEILAYRCVIEPPKLILSRPVEVSLET